MTATPLLLALAACSPEDLDPFDGPDSGDPPAASTSDTGPADTARPADTGPPPDPDTITGEWAGDCDDAAFSVFYTVLLDLEELADGAVQGDGTLAVLYGTMTSTTYGFDYSITAAGARDGDDLQLTLSASDTLDFAFVGAVEADGERITGVLDGADCELTPN